MAKTEDVRSFNKNLVLAEFKQYGICTKNQIAKNTQLSLGTCTNMLKILLEEGTITRIEDAPSKKGRKNKQYVLNEEKSCYICLRQNQAIVYDAKGKEETRCDITSNEHLEQYLSDIKNIKSIISYNCPFEIKKEHLVITEAKACLYDYLNSQKEKNKMIACLYIRQDKTIDLAISINDQIIFGKDQKAGQLSILKLDDKVKSNVNKIILNLIAYLNLDEIIIYSKKEIELKKGNKYKDIYPHIVFNLDTEKALENGLKLALNR